MRRAALISGLTFLVLAWIAMGLARTGHSFAIHMLVHMAVVAIAAPLIAVGVSGTRFDPVSGWTGLTPIVASLVEMLIVWFWHMPFMRGLVERSIAAGMLEQLSFLVGGIVLWLACIGGARQPARLAGIIGLLFTSIHMTLLGVLLALAPRPLYASADVSCFGISLSATSDQQIGGVIMLLVGAASYLAGGLTLLYRLLDLRQQRC